MSEQLEKSATSAIEDLKANLESLQDKMKARDELKNSIINLQEEIISELGERMGIIEKKSSVVFKAGFWTGLITGTTICLIIDLLIVSIR
tara:strand:+ start:99 stop:368 length:270 start_codon:yes stop_codon:yes gene_type:complete